MEETALKFIEEAQAVIDSLNPVESTCEHNNNGLTDSYFWKVNLGKLDEDHEILLLLYCRTDTETWFGYLQGDPRVMGFGLDAESADAVVCKVTQKLETFKHSIDTVITKLQGVNSFASYN